MAFLCHLVILAVCTLVLGVHDPRIEKTGTWSSINAFDGGCGVCFITVPGNSASLFFKGIAIYYTGSKNSSGGLTHVSLDGVQTVINTVGSSLLCGQVLYQKTGLNDQLHNITITFIGASPGTSSDSLSQASTTLQDFTYSH